jgi:excisionase family DNA binding protein
MSATATPRRLISVKTAEECYSVSRWTIRRRIAAGELTGYKLGPRILRVDADELDALFTQIPTADGG